MMNTPDQYYVTIERAASGGYGITYIEGKIVFVEGGIPDEKVVIEITADKKDFSFAKIISVISESQHRVSPICPIFDLCGGCVYQNISYEFELELKKNILIDNLKRIAKIHPDYLPEIETIFSERFFYRSHGRFFIRGGAICSITKKSHDFVPLPETGCAIMHPLINDFIKGNSFNTNSAGELRIAVSSQGEIFTDEDDDKEFCELELGFKYMRNIYNFFQSNIYMRSEMLEKVKKFSDIGKNNTFIDIACGIGFFTIPLAQHSKYGIGIDANLKNIESAKKNCMLNEVSNLSFICDNFQDIGYIPSDCHPKTVIIDPPRLGLELSAINSIIDLKPKTIVYVSCNPSIFARDLKVFIAHNYYLEKLNLLDCFPCTHHIELIGKIIRNDKT